VGRAGKQPFFLEISAVAIWVYLLFALAAGAMLPIQFGINAQLAEWIGGSVRAAFVSFLVGVVALFVAVQAIASLAVDHFGWVGFEEQPITALRIVGVLLLAGGVALVRLS
jgi:bacterial/archaeal transporter family-2 protein